MKAIVINHTGSEDVLVLADADDPVPQPDQVLVEVSAAGVNFIDIYQRSGLYQMSLPYIPGSEGAGTIVAVGTEVTTLAVGDNVAWTGHLGSYAQLVAIPAAGVVRVPDGVTNREAAAAMLQGVTAHYLVTSTFELGAGHRCLIHAGAGGVGAILIQMAKRVGAEVFATVGTHDKAEIASAAGADHVIVYTEIDFAAAVTDIAGPKCLDVVYDGVGQSVFMDSIKLLRRRGTMATFGNASGPVDPIPPLLLSQLGSLFLTRPSLGDYMQTREELEWRTSELFAWVASGDVNISIGLELPLASAADAHRLLGGRDTTGKVLLTP